MKKRKSRALRLTKQRRRLLSQGMTTPNVAKKAMAVFDRLLREDKGQRTYGAFNSNLEYR